jgi:hypothetical protein
MVERGRRDESRRGTHECVRHISQLLTMQTDQEVRSLLETMP